MSARAAVLVEILTLVLTLIHTAVLTEVLMLVLYWPGGDMDETVCKGLANNFSWYLQC